MIKIKHIFLNVFLGFLIIISLPKILTAKALMANGKELKQLEIPTPISLPQPPFLPKEASIEEAPSPTPTILINPAPSPSPSPIIYQSPPPSPIPSISPSPSPSTPPAQVPENLTLDSTLQDLCLFCFENLPEHKAGNPTGKHPYMNGHVTKFFGDQFGNFNSLLERYKNNFGNRPQFYIEKHIIPQDSKIIVIGDIHASLHSLLRDLYRLRNDKILSDNFKLTDGNYLVFTGNYADKGYYGLEVIYTLMKLKIENPDNVFLLRGCHEETTAASAYGLKKECKAKNFTNLNGICSNFFQTLACSLFLSILIPNEWIKGVPMPSNWVPGAQTSNWIQFVHAGIIIQNIESQLSPSKPITNIENFLDDRTKQFEEISKEEAVQYLYGEFSNSEDNFPTIESNQENSTNTFFKIGADQESYKNYFKKNNISKICRGHNYVPGGILTFSLKSIEWQQTTNADSSYPNKRLFMFMNCPEGMGYEGLNEDAYGIWTLTNKAWVLDASHIYSRDHYGLDISNLDKWYVQPIFSDNRPMTFQLITKTAPIPEPIFQPADLSTFTKLITFSFINLPEHKAGEMHGNLIYKTDYAKDFFGENFENFNTLLTQFLNTYQNRPPFYMEKALIPEDSKIIEIGDIHSSLHSLLRDLYRLYTNGILLNNFKLTDNFHLVFTGDYADRGYYGLEVIYTLMKLKTENPTKVFLTRGNHEEKNIAARDGLLKECLAKNFANNTYAKFLFDNICSKFFSKLASTIFLGIQTNTNINWIQFMHGSIFTKEMGTNIPQIKDINLFLNPATTQSFEEISEQEASIYSWGDFCIQNGLFINTHRGIGYTVGPDILDKYFKEHNNISIICRGHEHTPGGILILDLTNPSNRTVWRPIIPSDNISENKLFMFMNCPEGIGFSGTNHTGLNEDAYGIWRFENGNWVLNNSNIYSRKLYGNTDILDEWYVKPIFDAGKFTNFEFMLESPTINDFIPEPLSAPKPSAPEPSMLPINVTPDIPRQISPLLAN